MPNEAPSRRMARWLLAASATLIAYGSLYPFNFSAPMPPSLSALVAAFGTHRPSRGDFVTNLLLYLPIGLTLVPAVRWRSSARALAGATLAGFAFSVVIESFQVLAPARDTSVSDVVLNTVSTALGAAAALTYPLLRVGALVPGLRPRLPDPATLGLLGLWLVYRWTPFVPTLDWQKYKNALKPLLRWEDFGWLSTARYALGWLVVAHAVRLLWRAPWSFLAMGVITGVTLAAQVVVVGRALRSTEIAALIFVAVVAPLLARLSELKAAAVLLALAVPVIIATGLEPWHLLGTPGRFSWLPFRNSMSGSMELNAFAFAEKAFLYGALLWLMTRVGVRAMVAGLVVAPGLALIEVAQRWLPGRSAEITDPLLTLGIALVLAALQESGRTGEPARLPAAHERRR